MTQPEYPDHAQEALDLIDGILANYHETTDPEALKSTLDRERWDYQMRLAADVCLGLLSPAEEREIYKRMKWVY